MLSFHRFYKYKQGLLDRNFHLTCFPVLSYFQVVHSQAGGFPILFVHCSIHQFLSFEGAILFPVLLSRFCFVVDSFLATHGETQIELDFAVEVMLAAGFVELSFHLQRVEVGHAA